MEKNELQGGKVAQSYLSTIMKGRFSNIELKFFMQIVKEAQAVFDPDVRLNGYIGKALCPDGIHVRFSLPISEIMSDNSHNYGQVKQAMERLMQKRIEHYDYQERIIKFTPLIADGKIELGTGVVSFECARWALDLILDFSKGFSLYYFQSALSLRRSSSMRLYMLLCNQRGEITFSIKFLKEMFGNSECYAQTTDFIRRIIAPAREELEKRNLNGFDYKTNKKGRVLESITFFPIKREQPTDASELQRGPMSLAVPRPLQQYLMTQCGFTTKELSSNRSTLYRFTQVPLWQKRLDKIIENYRKKRAGHGYIINAMKSCVDENLLRAAKTKP